MQNKFIKQTTLKLIILIQILPTLIYPNKFTFASDLDTKPTTDYLRNIPKNNFYLLGPGDELALRVSEEARELDSRFTINGQGTAYLKRLKNIYVEGLTLEELKSLLNEEFSKYVFSNGFYWDVCSKQLSISWH